MVDINSVALNRIVRNLEEINETLKLRTKVKTIKEVEKISLINPEDIEIIVKEYYKFIDTAPHYLRNDIPSAIKYFSEELSKKSEVVSTDYFIQEDEQNG